jgi:ParB/RepB/Spo0J family partition protein
MSKDQFAHIALAVITPSLTNPRKHFNPAKLAELATSIAASGVHQPVLLRPLPGARVADTDRKVEYELVCGERRYRASLEAGVATIPAMIRALTDDQVMEIQIVENLQRDDLSELEEAEGFQALMQHAGLNAEQVGAKIGKSRAHVYGRLKLLDLGSDGRTALREGKIEASVALLLARIPDSKLQTKALKEVMAGAYDYDTRKMVPMSHRAALSLVQNNYMLKLANAIFDIKSVDLVPAAGACEACPKRTGHAPELFQDVPSADVCTDPTCFHKKEEAHSAAQVAEAEAKGLTVIAGKEAQELRGNSYQDKLKGYRRLDSAEDSPTDQPLRKIIGAQMKADGIKPVLIEDPRKKGELLECLPNETVLKLIKIVEGQAAAAGQASAGEKAPKVSAGVQKLVDDKKAKTEAKAKAQYEREWRANLVTDTWVTMRDDADIEGFTTEVHRFLAVRAARNLSGEDASAIAKLLGLGKIALGSAVVEFAKETANPELLQLLIIMQEASGTDTHTYGGRIPNEGLLLVAGNVFGKQLDDVIKEIKAEVKDKIWPKVAKTAKTATVPAAPPKEGAGGNGGKGAAAKKPPARAAKLSAEEATQGIAAAMQGIEAGASAKAVAPQTGQLGLAVGFAVGQAVQVTTDSSKFPARLTMHKWLGKKGTITGRVGKAWDVTFKGRNGGVASFDEDEISLVEEAVAA